MEKQKNPEELDFIIINPPFNPIQDHNNLIPNGSLYLAESLINKSYSVTILDDSVENIKKALNEKVSAKTLGFAILSIPGFQLKNAFEISKFIKNKYPSKPVIFAGARLRFMALPIQVLDSEFVDFVLMGEGEQSLPKLLNALKNKSDVSNIKGIGYKKNNQKFFTENEDYTPVDRTFNLPYHLLDMEKYARRLDIGVKRCFSIFTSRGCPFKCKFCLNSSTLWDNTKMRFYTIESIIKNISVLVNDYKADAITILDENFFINEARVIEICHALKKANFNVIYRAAGRVDTLSNYKESTWKLMKEVGFAGIAIGIESGSQKILNYLNKGISLQLIYNIDNILTKYGFFKSYNFMPFVPTESIDDVKETLRLIIDLAKTSKYCPYPFVMYKFAPIPNTQLFDTCIKEYGLKIPTNVEEWEKYDDLGVVEQTKQNRPWISDETWNYTSKAFDLVNELNSLYTGKTADNSKIDLKIKEIQSFLESGF